MGLVQSVLEGMSRLRADAEGGSSGAPAPWDDYWYYSVGAGSSTGIRITAHFSHAVASIVAGAGLIRLALLLGAARRNPPIPPSDHLGLGRSAGGTN